MSEQDQKRLAELERERARLTRRLKEAEAVIELQREIARRLGIPLTPPSEVTEED